MDIYRVFAEAGIGKSVLLGHMFRHFVNEFGKGQGVDIVLRMASAQPPFQVVYHANDDVFNVYPLRLPPFVSQIFDEIPYGVLHLCDLRDHTAPEREVSSDLSHYFYEQYQYTVKPKKPTITTFVGNRLFCPPHLAIWPLQLHLMTMINNQSLMNLYRTHLAKIHHYFYHSYSTIFDILVKIQLIEQHHYAKLPQHEYYQQQYIFSPHTDQAFMTALNHLDFAMLYTLPPALAQPVPLLSSLSQNCHLLTQGGQQKTAQGAKRTGKSAIQQQPASDPLHSPPAYCAEMPGPHLPSFASQINNTYMIDLEKANLDQQHQPTYQPDTTTNTNNNNTNIIIAKTNGKDFTSCNETNPRDSASPH
jgi:hypothetical protein